MSRWSLQKAANSKTLMRLKLQSQNQRLQKNVKSVVVDLLVESKKTNLPKLKQQSLQRWILSKKILLKSKRLRVSLSLGRSADPNRNHKLKSLQIQKTTSKALINRLSRRKKTSLPTLNLRSQQIDRRRSLPRKKRQTKEKLSRRASLKHVRQRKSQRISSTMEGKHSVSGLISQTIVTKVGVSTNHSGVIGETLDTSEEVTTVAVVRISTPVSTATNPTTKAIGCTMETPIQVATSMEGAIDTKDRASTKDNERLEHLVNLLSPQVMVDQAKVPMMSSFMTERSSKSVNYQPGQLKKSIPWSD